MRLKTTIEARLCRKVAARVHWRATGTRIVTPSVTPVDKHEGVRADLDRSWPGPEPTLISETAPKLSDVRLRHEYGLTSIIIADLTRHPGLMSSLPGAAEATAYLKRADFRDFAAPADESHSLSGRRFTLDHDDIPVPELARYALALIGLDVVGAGEKIAWSVCFDYRGVAAG